MSLFKIAWRSIQQRGLSSSLTALSMALGVALVIAVLVIHGVISRSFEQGAEGYELIIGAKGGKLQLVLNTVYHLSTPVGNIPWSYYKEFREGGRYAKYVRFAVPYCLGDNYQGFRIVGTTPELFQIEYAQDKQYEFLQGRNFEQEHYFESVVGYLAARRTGLKVGDQFNATHGVSEGDVHKKNAFTVVGILAPTGTPNDRAVFVNMEGFFLLEGHALEPTAKSTADADKKPSAKVPERHEGHDDELKALPEEQREVTAVLVRCVNQIMALDLPKRIAREPYGQAVFPVREIRSLFDNIVGTLQMVLVVLTILIVVVSGIGIMVSIYNSMSERRREIAIMRALGASRGAILSIVLLESILLSVFGGLLGILLGHGLVGVISPFVVTQTGVSLSALQFSYAEWAVELPGVGPVTLKIYWELVLIPGLVILASLVGFLPGVAAYRTNVSKALTATG